MAVEFERITHVVNTVVIAGFPVNTLFWQYADGFIDEGKTRTFTNAQVLTALGNGDMVEYDPPEPVWAFGRLRRDWKWYNRDYVILDGAKLNKPAREQLELIKEDSIGYSYNEETDEYTIVLKAVMDEDGKKLANPRLNVLRSAIKIDGYENIKNRPE